jgi:hypothetical protein
MPIATLPTLSPVSVVAKRNGFSEWTIRQEIKRGNLRARRIGRCVRILDEDEAAWLRGADAKAMP